MELLFNFVSVLIAAACGALMAPAFTQFLNKEENKQKQQLAYLEELYLLSLELKNYGSRLPVRTAMLLNTLENNGDVSALPPETKDPFNRMEILLDYHLAIRPDNLYNKVKELNKEAIEMNGPIVELVGYKYKITDRGPLNLKAFELSLNVSAKCQGLAEELSAYAKQEKNKIDMELTNGFFYKLKNCFNQQENSMKDIKNSSNSVQNSVVAESYGATPITSATSPSSLQQSHNPNIPAGQKIKQPIMNISEEMRKRMCYVADEKTVDIKEK